MKLSTLRANDGCWASDGRWPSPSRPENLDIKVAGFENLVKRSLQSRLEATAENPETTPEEIAILWLAGYSPAQARKLFCAALKTRDGSPHRFSVAYSNTWPLIFSGEISFPQEWLNELMQLGCGPWSDLAPVWLSRFFSLPSSAPQVSPSALEELRPVARVVESLRLLIHNAPGSVTAKVALTALGSPFDTIDSEGDGVSSVITHSSITPDLPARPKESPEAAEIRRRNLAFGAPTELPDYMIFYRLNGVKNLAESGLPLCEALTAKGFPTDRFDPEITRFPEMPVGLNAGSAEELVKYRQLLDELHENAYKETEGRALVGDILERSQSLCFPELVPRNNSELEPLLSYSVLKVALRDNGGKPYLDRFDQNLVLRLTLETMIEAYYGLSVNTTACGVDVGDGEFTPLQPLRFQSRFEAMLGLPDQQYWVPFMGSFHKDEIGLALGMVEAGSVESYCSPVVLKSIRDAYKKPDEEPAIPVPAIVDLSDPKLLEHVRTTGDVSGLWTWSQYTQVTGREPPTPKHPLSEIRTRFDFSKFQLRLLKLAIAARNYIAAEPERIRTRQIINAKILASYRKTAGKEEE